MMKIRVRVLLLLLTGALTLFVVFFVNDEKPNTVEVKVSITNNHIPCKYLMVNVNLHIRFQDNKPYSQKFKAQTHFNLAKQQYIIHPPRIERILPNRSEIVPRDAVWQKVQSTKYCVYLRFNVNVLTNVFLS